MNRTCIAIAGLALIATACTNGSTGDPKPGTSTEIPTSTASSTAAGDGNLASVKPCELISDSEASTLSLESPEPGRSAGADSCEWSGANRSGLTVAVEPTQGADGFNYEGETKTPAKFGKYEGFKVAAANKGEGLCDVVISVSESSSVQIIASTSTSSPDTAKACEIATKSAELVAAKLP